MNVIETHLLEKARKANSEIDVKMEIEMIVSGDRSEEDHQPFQLLFQQCFQHEIYWWD